MSDRQAASEEAFAIRPDQVLDHYTLLLRVAIRVGLALHEDDATSVRAEHARGMRTQEFEVLVEQLADENDTYGTEAHAFVTSIVEQLPALRAEALANWRAALANLHANDERSTVDHPAVAGMVDSLHAIVRFANAMRITRDEVILLLHELHTKS